MLYYRCGSDGKIGIMTTYVDGLLLIGDNGEEIQRMVEYQLGRYEGRDLGVPERLVPSFGLRKRAL